MWKSLWGHWGVGHEGVEQHLTVHIAEIYSLFAFFFQTNKQKSWAKINMWRHTNKQSILFYLFFKKNRTTHNCICPSNWKLQEGTKLQNYYFPHKIKFNNLKPTTVFLWIPCSNVCLSVAYNSFGLIWFVNALNALCTGSLINLKIILSKSLYLPQERTSHSINLTYQTYIAICTEAVSMLM